MDIIKENKETIAIVFYEKDRITLADYNRDGFGSSFWVIFSEF